MLSAHMLTAFASDRGLEKHICTDSVNSGDKTGMRGGSRATAKQVVDHYKADLQGKVALVTGGNSGIGVETCKALAHAGAKVIMCSRNLQNGLRAIEKEVKLTGLGGYSVPNASIVVKEVDLADLHSVRKLASELIAEMPNIDYFILNAGIMACPLAHTKHKFESQMGTNHFGHFYLIKLMMDTIKQNRSRVVVVSSAAHTMGKIDIQDMHFRNKKYSAWAAYGQSKLANILFAKSLADQGVFAVSLHPGSIPTNLSNNMEGPKWMSWLIKGALTCTGKTIPQGAATTLYACLCPDLKSGSYLCDCGVAKPSKEAEDVATIMRYKLWLTTEEQIRDVMGDI